MAGEPKATTDHNTIKKWVEARGGKPATAIFNGWDGEFGILRINFPNNNKVNYLNEISWEEFFDKFDTENLAFLYQEKTSDGALSKFNKFVKHESSVERIEEWF